MQSKNGAPARRARRTYAYESPDFDWRRFWIRSLVAVFIFNIVAALVTWFIIFPILFPAH